MSQTTTTSVPEAEDLAHLLGDIARDDDYGTRDEAEQRGHRDAEPDGRRLHPARGNRAEIVQQRLGDRGPEQTQVRDQYQPT
jgi:hypothetical protein